MSSGPQLSCKRCPKTRAEGFSISYRGLCEECAEAAMVHNNRQISAHSGPYFQHQRLRTLAAWGGVPLDVVQPRP